MSRHSVTSISTDWGDDPGAAVGDNHEQKGGGGGGGDKDGQYYVYNSGEDELYEIPSQEPPEAPVGRNGIAGNARYLRDFSAAESRENKQSNRSNKKSIVLPQPVSKDSSKVGRPNQDRGLPTPPSTKALASRWKRLKTWCQIHTNKVVVVIFVVLTLLVFVILLAIGLSDRGRISRVQQQILSSFLQFSSAQRSANEELKLLVSADKSGNLSCPDGFVMKPTLGKCYFFNLDYKPWAEAQTHCRLLGANLVAPSTSDEDNFIQAEIARLTFIKHLWWLGAKCVTQSYDCQSLNSWKWLAIGKETNMTYTNWKTGHPMRNGFCMKLSVPSWQTENCASESAFICENKIRRYDGTSI